MHDRGGFHCLWNEVSWLLLTEHMEQKHNVPAHFFRVFVQPEWKLLGEALWFGSSLHTLDKSRHKSQVDSAIVTYQMDSSGIERVSKYQIKDTLH